MTSASATLAQIASIGLRPIGPGEIDPTRAAAPGGPANAFADIVQVVGATTVIEVGSWEGRSAILWAEYLSERTADWLLICVDTWLGSYEMWPRESGDWSREKLRITDGYPTVFSTFASTVRRAGFENHTVALPIDSAQGMELLKRHQVTADVVYVDAAHDFLAALNDIRRARELINPVNPRSLVLCDDFMRQWSGVMEAVFASAQETGSRILVRDCQAALVPSTAGQEMVDELLALEWREVSVESVVGPASSANDSVARLTGQLSETYGIVYRANESLREKRKELHDLKVARRALEKNLRQMRKKVTRHREELTTVRSELAGMLNSRSWKMTAWIRTVRATLSSQRRK